MGTFSNDYFEYNVSRCLNFLILRYHHQIRLARDKEFAKSLQRKFWNSFQEHYDKCSLVIAEKFDWHYKLGHSISDILNHTRNIIDQFEYQEMKTRRKEMIWRTYYKKFKNFHFTLKIPTFMYVEWPQVPIAESFRYKNKPDLDERTIFMALVRYRSACLFRDFLLSEKTNPDDGRKQCQAPIKHIQSSFIDEDSVLKWTKPKTEFYKLVYALHASGYIKGEITRLMEGIAPAFGIQLAKSWQSSVSKNMDYSNAGYDNTGIFDELKTAFIKHVEERENNKKR